MNFHKYFLMALTSAFVASADQASKIYIHTQLQLGDPIVAIKGFFNISYVRNSGGAFGLFGESPPIVRQILFLLFPLFCVFLIFMMLKETHNKIQVTALGFILGGAIGNYIDRVRFGYVVDFIDWYVGRYHWPTFNIADSFIVIGVSTLCYFYLTEKKSKSN